MICFALVLVDVAGLRHWHWGSFAIAPMPQVVQPKQYRFTDYLNRIRNHIWQHQKLQPNLIHLHVIQCTYRAVLLGVGKARSAMSTETAIPSLNTRLLSASPGIAKMARMAAVAVSAGNPQNITRQHSGNLEDIYLTCSIFWGKYRQPTSRRNYLAKNGSSPSQNS